MNTFQLACFTEVASTLNFSLAARNLGVSQPAVSHNIKALETELGCTLIARSARSVSMTEEGLQYLTYARDILDLAAQGAHRVSHQRADEFKLLRIGVHGGVEAMALAPALRAFHREKPEVTPDVRIGPHSALLNMLEGNTLDVMLEYQDPQGAAAEGPTVFRRLTRMPVSMLCAPDHPWARAPKIEARDLSRVGRVAICDPYASFGAIDALQRRVLTFADVRDVVMCSSVEGTVALAAAGIAVAVMPSVSVPYEQAVRAVPVGGLPRLAFGARVRRGERDDAVEAFLRLLSEHIVRRGGGADAPQS